MRFRIILGDREVVLFTKEAQGRGECVFDFVLGLRLCASAVKYSLTSTSTFN